MQRSTSSVIPRSQIKASKLEVIDRDGHVSLRCNMNHIYAKVVLSLYIGPIRYQNVTNVSITLK